MNCLCCGKPLGVNAKVDEIENEWHRSCVNKFFNTSQLPSIDISDEVLEGLVIESTNKGFTVPGVQKKLSLHLTMDANPRLTLVNYPTGYILKPQTDQYTALPEAEYLVMQMAKMTGIKTVPFAMIKSQYGNNYAYITKRIDRKFSMKKNYQVQKLAMEDFCQLEGRLTKDKYRGSYERCAKIITKYSSQELLDQSELFLRIIFSFVVGNADMHLKNFSLIENDFKRGAYVLSAAYDLLCVNVVLPEDSEQLALTLNGKKRNLRKNDFLKFAYRIGMNEKSAIKLIKKIVSMEEKYIAMCKQSLLPEEMKIAFEKLLIDRLEVLK